MFHYLSILLTIIIILHINLQILLVNCGNIWSNDIKINPNNKNNPSTFTFYFTLETNLAIDDYMRMVLPFKLNSITIGYWDIYNNCNDIMPNHTALITTSTITGDTNAYFIQFFSDTVATIPSTMSSNIEYFLTFTGTIDSTSPVGNVGPIELYTVSNNIGNWIIYDSNPIFGYIELENDFPKAMTVSVTIPTSVTNQNIMSSTYQVLIDISPTVTIYTQARIDISPTNNTYQISNCISIADTNLNIPLLPVTTTQVNTYTVRLNITQTLAAALGQKYRFQCQIKNSGFPSTSGIEVTNWAGFANQIIEQGSSPPTVLSASLSTDTGDWIEANHHIYFAWGYDLAASSILDPFKIYKDKNGYERWYQSVKIVFYPSRATTTTANLQVIMTTISDVGFLILGNSLLHNLPDYSTQLTAACTVTKGRITCINIGQLNSQGYFISFRFNLPYTTTLSSVSTFGQVTLMTLTDPPVVILPTSQTTITNKAIYTNVQLFTSSGTNGVLAKTGANPYITSGTGTLSLTFNYFSRSIIPATTSIANLGIEFYTSYSIPNVTSPTCTISTLVTGTDIDITDCQIVQNANYTKMAFRINRIINVAVGSNYNNLFTTSINTGTINFGTVNYPYYSSLHYVNEKVYDIYGRWVQNWTSTSSAGLYTNINTATFFFNTLVYQSGALANVNVGSTFFATGSSSTTPTSCNNGNYFPTLIRVTGYLTAGEITLTNRLLIFFNDLIPLNTNTPCFSSVGVTCHYNDGLSSNTATNNLVDYSGSRRIEITLNDPTLPFNIYIPVSTIPSLSTIGYFIASAMTITTQASNLGIFSTTLTKRIAAYTSTPFASASLTINTQTATTTPKLTIPASSQMGGTINSVINTITGNYPITGTAINSGSNVGAAYGYCGDYDFTINSGFTFTPFRGAISSSASDCVKVQYTYYSTSSPYPITCQVCPVNAVMTSSVAVNNFKLPINRGADYGYFVFVSSNNYGDIGTLTGGTSGSVCFDIQANRLSTFSLSGHSITFSPSLFKSNSMNQMVKVNFTITSILPEIIQILFEPVGASTSLLFNPVTTQPCQCLTQALVSCVVGGSYTSITLTMDSSTYSWPIGQHSVYFYANSIFPSITSDQTIHYDLKVLVYGVSGTLASTHHSSTSNTYIFSNSVIGYIQLGSIQYTFSNRNAMTAVSFSFNIPNDVIYYPGQILQFYMGDLALANPVGSPPNLCNLLDSSTGLITNKFLSCNSLNLAQLQIITKSPIQGNYTIILDYLRVPSTTTPTGISVSLISFDQVNIVTSNLPSTPLTLPYTYTMVTIRSVYINIQRKYNDAGSIGEIVIKLTPTKQSIQPTSTVYIYFPPYYSPKLGYKNIYCLGNTYQVSCTLIASRLLAITSFPFTTSIANTLIITIYGIITPVIPSSYQGTIFIGYDNDTNYNQLIEQAIINDPTLNSGTPSIFSPNNLNMTSLLIRQNASLSFWFFTDSIGIRSGSIFAIDFPDEYGAVVQGATPKFYLIPSGKKAVSLSVNNIGSRFKVTLPTDLQAVTNYTILLTGITTPDFQICVCDHPTINVMSSDEITTTYRSSPNSFNSDPISYIPNPLLQTISIYYNGNQITEFHQTIGIFSPILTIVPQDNSTFGQSLSFNVDSTKINLLPNPTPALLGASTAEFRIGANSSLFPGINYVFINKSEGLANSMYQAMPRFKLILNNIPQTVPAPTIEIPIGGTSLPYSWDFESLDLIPFTDVKIDASVPTLGNGGNTYPLSILGGVSIQFTSQVTFNSFTFTLSENAIDTETYYFNLGLSGSDASSYVLQSNKVLITIISPPSAAAVFNSILFQQYLPTQQKLTVNMDQKASIYWHVAYKGTINSTSCAIVKANVQDGVKFDTLGANQDQYGVFYVYQAYTPTSTKIANLLANTQYDYILCAVNLMGTFTTYQQGVFQTVNGKSGIWNVSLSFGSILGKFQIKSLCCFFSNQLSIPSTNVIADEGTSCAAYTTYDQKQTSITANFTIYIFSDRHSDINSTIDTKLANALSVINNNTAGTLLNVWQSTLLAGSIFTSFRSISSSQMSDFPLPVISNDPLIIITYTNFISISGLKLTSGPGIFYGICSPETVKIPKYYQIKNKTNSSNTIVPSSNVFYYGISPVTFTFTNLTSNTTYTIYYYATSLDLSSYARTTDINVLQVQTLVKIKSMLLKLHIALYPLLLYIIQFVFL